MGKFSSLQNLSTSLTPSPGRGTPHRFADFLTLVERFQQLAVTAVTSGTVNATESILYHPFDQDSGGGARRGRNERRKLTASVAWIVSHTSIVSIHVRHLRHPGEQRPHFPERFWSVPPIRWRTAGLTIRGPSSFNPTLRHASKLVWAAAGWRFSIFRRWAISPCRMLKPETGSSTTAKSTISANSGRDCRAKACVLSASPIPRCC